MVINTPTRGKLTDRLGFIIRRPREFNVPCITSMDTLAALLSVMGAEDIETSLQEYLNYDKDLCTMMVAELQAEKEFSQKHLLRLSDYAG